MNLEEFLNSPDEGKHIFTDKELQTCAEQGKCCQCGACCIIFENTIPLIKNEVTKTLGNSKEGSNIFKKCLIPCPHLTETPDGFFPCSINEIRNKNQLLVPRCKAWMGNTPLKSSLGEYSNEYGRMVNSVEEIMVFEPAVEDFPMIEKMMIRGSLPKMDIFKKYAPSYLISLLKTCISDWPGEKIPHLFLEKIGFKEWITSMAPNQKEAWKSCLKLDSATLTPIQKEFTKMYFTAPTPHEMNQTNRPESTDASVS